MGFFDIDTNSSEAQLRRLVDPDFDAECRRRELENYRQQTEERRRARQQAQVSLTQNNTQNNQHNEGATINHYEGATVYNAPVVQGGGDYVNGDKIIHNHPQPAPEEAEVISVDIPTPPIERIANAVEQINGKIPDKAAQPLAEGAAPGSLNNINPTKEAIIWLAKKQMIKKHTFPEESIMKEGAIDRIKPASFEYRITRPATKILDALMEAADTSNIQLEKNAIPDFIKNNLKAKGGGDLDEPIRKALEKREKTGK
jgi:hypothetical protein